MSTVPAFWLLRRCSCGSRRSPLRLPHAPAFASLLCSLNVFRVVCVSSKKEKETLIRAVLVPLRSVRAAPAASFCASAFSMSAQHPSRTSTKQPHREPHVYCRTARWAMHRHPLTHVHGNTHAAHQPKCSGRVMSPTLHTVSPQSPGAGKRRHLSQAAALTLARPPSSLWLPRPTLPTPPLRHPQAIPAAATPPPAHEPTARVPAAGWRGDKAIEVEQAPPLAAGATASTRGAIGASLCAPLDTATIRDAPAAARSRPPPPPSLRNPQAERTERGSSSGGRYRYALERRTT